MGLISTLDNLLITSRNLFVMSISTGATAGGTGEITSGTTWDPGSINGAIDESFTNVGNTVQKTGNSVVYIIMMLVGFIGVIGLGVAAIKIMVGGATTKSEAKGSMFWIILALIIGFGAIAIVGIAQTVGSGLFSGGTVTPTG